MNKKWLATGAFAIATALSATSGWAQTSCPPPILNGTELDTDGDGFADILEVCGIQLYSSTTRIVTDPATKDVFVSVVIAPGGVIEQIFGVGQFNPFKPVTYLGNGINVTFNGQVALGLNVHVIGDADTDPQGTRLVDFETNQHAVRIAEDTSTTGTILGNCQWGTPDGFDGCVVYTQRIKNFIDTNCPGNTAADRALMFKAYVTESFLHETGHSLGGLAPTYNSRTGGYHYKSGSGLVMEQSVAYSAKNGTCTWYISPAWNLSSDPQSVRLK